MLGVSVYSNTFRSSFVFDDLSAIVENPAIRHLNLPTLWQAFNTRFIVGLSLAFNYALGRENVVGYHLFNTLVHILNSYLVYQLVCLTVKTPRMFKSVLSTHPKLIGFLAALVFLTHPIQTQGVTYVWQRASSLAAFFYLLSLVFYARFRWKSLKRDLVLSLFAAVLGMFTKEITFTLPAAVALYEFCFLRASDHKKIRSFLFLWPYFLMLPIIPLTLAVGGGESTLRLLRPEVAAPNAMSRGIAWSHWLDITKGVEKEKIPRREYMFTQLNVLRTYLCLLFIPLNQNLDYDYPKSVSFAEWPTVASFLLLAGLFALAVGMLNKEPIIAFSIFWFFLTLSVESLVSQKEFIFEHRLYLPMVGFSLFLVTTMAHFFRNNIRGLILALLGIVACYSFLTYQRNFVWKDEISLWSDVIGKSPNKLRPYKNRGSAYQREGHLDQALADFSKAIELEPANPDNADSYSNRCSVYGMKGLLDQALADGSRAIQLSPTFAEAYNNRAIIYKQKGDLDQALMDYNKAIELRPKFAIAYNNRGSVYGMKGLLDHLLSDSADAQVSLLR